MKNSRDAVLEKAFDPRRPLLASSMPWILKMMMCSEVQVGWQMVLA